ncbi:MAG: hypothetical protein IPH03_13655 [Tetrasphaera sp.]|nr:hypothetical protein [Tetrasphaera sp.]
MGTDPCATDNEKTVTVEHIAGIPVRNAQPVGFAEHYWWWSTPVSRRTRRPRAGPRVGKISKADLVPKDTNLLTE